MYLLRSDTEQSSRQLDFKGNSYIGGLTIASYIDQPGLVLEKGDGKIHEAKYHKWAEPLRVSLREYLSTELSAQLGYDVPPYKPSDETSQRIDISINKLHGDDSGNAVLLAYWSITGPEGTNTYQYSNTLALQADGYDALVAAEKNLLQQLAIAMAQIITKAN